MALSKGYPSHYASFRHPSLDFSQATNRLITFLSSFPWPEETGITPEELADEGFIFWKPPDIVQCVFCALKLHKWIRSIDPLQHHFQKSQGRCHFAMQRMALRRKREKEAISGEFLSIFYDRRSSGYQLQSDFLSQHNSISFVLSDHSQLGENQSANQIPAAFSEQTTANGCSERRSNPMNGRKTSDTSARDFNTVDGFTSAQTGQMARSPEKNEDLYPTGKQATLRGIKTVPLSIPTNRRTSIRSSTSDRADCSTNYGETLTSLDPSVRTDATPNVRQQFHPSSSHTALDVPQNGNKVGDASRNLTKPPLVHVPKASGACFRPSFSSEAAESSVFSGNSSEMNTIQPDPPFKPEQCENDDVTKSLISLVFDSDASGTTVKSKLDSGIPFGYYLNSAMDTDKVKVVLDEGYSRDVVLAVVTHRLKTDGDNFRSALDLLKAVFDYEDAKTS